MDVCEKCVIANEILPTNKTKDIVCELFAIWNLLCELVCMFHLLRFGSMEKEEKNT